MADEPQEVIGGGAPAPVEAAPSAGGPRERQFYGKSAPEQRAALQQTFNEVAPAIGPGSAGMALGQAGGTMVMRALSRVAPAVAKLPEPIMRIIMGAVGSGTGEALFEPEGSFTGGAARGAIAGAAGEIVGAGGGYIGRKTGILPSTKAKAAAGQAAAETAQSGQVASEMGGVLGKVAPPLQAQTPQDLSRLGIFHGDVRRELGQWQGTRLQEAQALTGGPETTFRVPAFTQGPKLSPAEETMLRRQLGLKPGQSIDFGKSTPQVLGPNGQSVGGERLTLEDATRQLSDIGQGVWRGSGETSVKLSKLEQARLYRQGRQEIMTELASHSPEAARIWDEGRYGFSAGNEVVRMLRKEKVFDRSPEDVQLDMKGLQTMFRRNAQALKDRLLPEDFRRLNNTIMRGKDITTGTAPAPVQRPIFTPGDYGQIYLNSMLERQLHAR